MLTWEKSESLMNSRGWWRTNTCCPIKRCVGIKDVWCDSKSVLEPWQKPKYIFNISFIHSCLCHWLSKKEKIIFHSFTILLFISRQICPLWTFQSYSSSKQDGFLHEPSLMAESSVALGRASGLVTWTSQVRVLLGELRFFLS